MSILFGIDWQHGADPLVTSSAGFPWFVGGGNASIAVDWSQAIESFKAAARSPAWAVCRMRVVSVVAYFMVSNG